MSLDLEILPQFTQGADYSHDVIKLDRENELLIFIYALWLEKGIETPNGIHSHRSIGIDEETCYGLTLEDAHGKPLKSILAKELKDALSLYKPQHWRNKAFLAYLKKMPNDLKLWLYWC
jgi:hypothetical protein